MLINLKKEVKSDQHCDLLNYFVQDIKKQRKVYIYIDQGSYHEFRICHSQYSPKFGGGEHKKYLETTRPGSLNTPNQLLLPTADDENQHTTFDMNPLSHNTFFNPHGTLTNNSYNIHRGHYISNPNNALLTGTPSKLPYIGTV